MTRFLYCVSKWLLSRIFHLILSFCSQITPFKTIWHIFIIVYPIDSFQDHMTWFLYCVPKLLLSRPFDLNYHWVPNELLSRPFHLIISLCTQLTTFNTIWPIFIIVYPIDSFQHHMAWFLHCVSKLTSFKTIWSKLSLCTQLTPFKTIWPIFIIVYPIDSFQNHMTSFLYCVTNWLLSRPFNLNYHCVPNWLLSRPSDLTFVLCTQVTLFKNLWPDFCIVYPIDFFQNHFT